MIEDGPEVSTPGVASVSLPGSSVVTVGTVGSSTGSVVGGSATDPESVPVGAGPPVGPGSGLCCRA